MNKVTLNQVQIQLAFVVTCIKATARTLGQSYQDVYAVKAHEGQRDKNVKLYLTHNLRRSNSNEWFLRKYQPALAKVKVALEEIISIFALKNKKTLCQNNKDKLE